MNSNQKLIFTITAISLGTGVLLFANTGNVLAQEDPFMGGGRGDGLGIRMGKAVTKDMRQEFKDDRAENKEQRDANKDANREQNQKEMADFLGLSTDELKTLRDSGKTIEEIFTQQGKTAEDVKTFMEKQAEEKVAEIAEKHDLSSEQVQTLTSRFSSFIQSKLGHWFK